MFEDKDWQYIALIACVAMLCGTVAILAEKRVEFERVRCAEVKP
jgi:hypothetical protein